MLGARLSCCINKLPVGQQQEQQSQVSTFHNIYNKHATATRGKKDACSFTGLCVAQLLATFSASCCVKFDTLAMFLLFLLQLLLLELMTTHCSRARHTGNIRVAAAAAAAMFGAYLCASVVFGPGYRIYVPLSYSSGVLLTIIHKYGQCVVNTQQAAVCQAACLCMLHATHTIKRQIDRTLR